MGAPHARGHATGADDQGGACGGWGDTGGGGGGQAGEVGGDLSDGSDGAGADVNCHVFLNGDAEFLSSTHRHRVWKRKARVGENVICQ